VAVHGLGERLRMCEADGRPTASAGAISRAVMQAMALQHRPPASQKL